jgi:hypothetical protein
MGETIMRMRSIVVAATVAAGLACGPALQAQAQPVSSSSLTAAKAGLDAHIARDIKVLDDVRSESHDPEIPLDQQAAYAKSIAMVIHFRSTTYSRRTIFAQSTAAAITGLANRWVAYHQEIIDLRSAVGLADDSGGGYLDPAGPEATELISELQIALNKQVANGTDETAALAALARVPADIAAVDAQARPLFAVLANADFRHHAVVAADLKAAAVVIDSGSAIVAFDNDLELVVEAAFPGVDLGLSVVPSAHAGLTFSRH